jgi:hypothetical protein
MRTDRAAASPAVSGRRAWRCVLAATLGASLVLPATLAAHPFFVQPTDFAPPPGKLIGFELWVGHPPAPQPMPRLAEHLESFTVLDALGAREVAGVEGIHPAGYLRPPEPGAMVVAYRSRPVTQELPLHEFLAYLEEEGLAGPRMPGCGDARVARDIPALRCARPLRAVPRRWSRSAAELGPEAEARVGCDLELVPELRDGAVASALLLLHGRGLPEARVLLMPLGGDRPDVELRTDRHGRVELPRTEGEVVLHAVYGKAAPAPPAWRSYWTSLTLRLPAPPAAAR